MNLNNKEKQDLKDLIRIIELLRQEGMLNEINILFLIKKHLDSGENEEAQEKIKLLNAQQTGQAFKKYEELNESGIIRALDLIKKLSE